MICRYLCCRALDNFINFDGEVRTHPDTNSTGITFLGSDKSWQLASLRVKFISRKDNASSGAKMGAVTTSQAKVFIDNHFTIGHIATFLYIDSRD